jgi:hypothetical protein
MSIGISHGSKRWLIKITKSENHDSFMAKIQYQNYLSSCGIPAPGIKCYPKQFYNALFMIMDYVDSGIFVDTSKPRYLNPIVDSFLKINNAYIKRNINIDPILIKESIDEENWNAPHNALFDFSRFPEETRWIDQKMNDSLELIKKRKSIDRNIISHHDWSGKHFRFSKSKITIIYDWDSLRYASIYSALAKAALTYVYNDEIGRPFFSTPDQIHSFLVKYQELSNSKFAEKEIELIAAHTTYTGSKIAKCMCTNIYIDEKDLIGAS